MRAAAGGGGDAASGRGGDFLAVLGEDDRRALEALGHRRSYERGDTVFRQGDDSRAAYVVVAGWGKLSLIEDGHELLLDLAGPGELLGELAALSGAPRMATLTALQPLEALVVTGDAFRAFLEDRPGVSLELLLLNGRRLRESHRHRVAFAAHDVLGRIALRLLELVAAVGETEDGGVAIALNLTQDDLAAWTAASREATARALASMRSLGWIETQRRRIVVRDVEALRHQARV